MPFDNAPLVERMEALASRVAHGSPTASASESYAAHAASNAPTVRADVVEAFLIAQETRLNDALRQASPSVTSWQQRTWTVDRLAHTFAHDGDARPTTNVDALVARAVTTLHRNDVNAHGHPCGGERMVEDQALKGAVGRLKYEALTSLTVCAHVGGAFPGHVNAPPQDLQGEGTPPTALERHHAHVLDALDQLHALHQDAVVSQDPDASSRARRIAEALASVQDHPEWSRLSRSPSWAQAQRSQAALNINTVSHRADTPAQEVAA